MTATIDSPFVRSKPRPSGLSLWPLIGVVSDQIGARRPLCGEEMGTGRDVLVVQVGPPVPYRLLVVESTPDGLIHMQLWSANGKMKVAEEASCTSDLTDVLLLEWASKYGLRH